MLKYLKEEGPMGDRLPMILCPGCGSGQVLNAAFHAIDKIIEEDGIAKENFVFISGVGCSARLTSHYLNFDSGWTIHGRTLPIATGALMANPELRIIVIMSQCPVHWKTSPVDMLKALKKNSVRLKADEVVPEGKIPVGEFCNIEKPEWIESYQKVMDQFN